jgi:pimeloyl-ACP methyl ester carboxylesterase
MCSEKYAAAGGKFEEVVLADCGHSPHIEHPEQWMAAFLRHVKGVAETTTGQE